MSEKWGISEFRSHMTHTGEHQHSPVNVIQHVVGIHSNIYSTTKISQGILRINIIVCFWHYVQMTALHPIFCKV